MSQMSDGHCWKKDIDLRQEVDKFVGDGAAGLDSLKEYPYI